MEFLGIKGTSKEEPKLADVKSASTLDMCNSSGNILYNTCNIALLSTNRNFIQYFEGCWFNCDISQGLARPFVDIHFRVLASRSQSTCGQRLLRNHCHSFE